MEGEMDNAEVDLDDTEGLAAIDASGMLGALERFPRQVREAIEIGQGPVELPSAEGLKAVVVLGMGGSGISGDVVASLTANSLRVPMATVKGYTLPEFVDENTLVFAVSYSGNTEETLDCVEGALERGAPVVAVASGGKLAEIAAERDLPLFQVPAGFQPRAALGYLFVPVLSALERIGLVHGLVGEVGAACEMLEERVREYGVAMPLDDNPAKRLARDLVGFLPVVYGLEGPLAVAALRWKDQFNENSKVPAFYNWFPELNHNETVGWQHLEDIGSRCHLIVLREQDEHPRVTRRIAITVDLIKDNVAHVTHVLARGSSQVERLLDLVCFGDHTSVFLALALEQDPTPVARIEELKRRLAEEP
ncbi:MAG: bifunctional phosphoglucose/phosphomannose isomerase [Actinobacteria bacterium]|nr:bifunctional phosphoglucose/phosphomannose isomerase [Actinomycetota bacterium]